MKNEIIHRKLVRDKIPKEIEDRGAACVYRGLDSPEFVSALADKLVEEAREAGKEILGYIWEGRKGNILEELADLKFVIDNAVSFFGYSDRQLNDAVCEKLRLKGGFSGRIFLERCWEPE